MRRDRANMGRECSVSGGHCAGNRHGGLPVPPTQKFAALVETLAPKLERLLDEHFRVEGWRTWFETIDEMQAVLDDFLVGYNQRSPHQGRGMNGAEHRLRPSSKDCQNRNSKRRTSEPKKNQPNKPPDADRSPRHRQPITLSVHAEDNPSRPQRACPTPVGWLSVAITSICISGTSFMRGTR